MALIAIAISREEDSHIQYFRSVFIYNIQLWDQTMQTMAMVITSVSLCIVLGIPLGILSAKSNTANRIIAPVLDFADLTSFCISLPPPYHFSGWYRRLLPL